MLAVALCSPRWPRADSTTTTAGNQLLTCTVSTRAAERNLHDLGDPVRGRPRDLHVTYSQHYCRRCDHYFNADMLDLAVPKGHYTHRVVALAVRCVVEDGLP